MSCPFLTEARVRYCHAASVRKMIAAPDGPSTDRCSTAEYSACQVYRSRMAEPIESPDYCPYLHEALVHYCSAAPVPKFVPFSEHGGRCNTDSFRFCELFLQVARGTSHGDVDPLHAPGDLYFTPNHLWLHVSEKGACHVGIDSLFAYVLGKVERISFVTTSGVQRPTAMITVGGIDWPVTFRNRMFVTGANVYLGHAPQRLTADPYGTGWLFEGWQLPDDSASEGLLTGRQAAVWMEHERARLDDLVHELPGSVANDGGNAASGVANYMEREDILRVLHGLFAPDRAWGDK